MEWVFRHCQEEHANLQATLKASRDAEGRFHMRCQEVARAARDDGYEAIRFPSARGAGENYAIFLDRLAPGSHLREDSREWI